MEEYNEGMKVMQSDQAPAPLAHENTISSSCPHGGGHISPEPLSSWLDVPLPFCAMGIRGCRKCQADVTYQLCDTPHTPRFLPVGPPLNSGWFWNGSSLGVSQSCQSPSQALSALTLQSQSTVTGEGEESTHLYSTYKGSFCICNQPQNVPGGLLWLWVGWGSCELNFSWGEIKLLGGKFM